MPRAVRRRGAAAEDRTQTRIEFYSPQIVRVVKYLSSEKAQPEKRSFTVVMKPERVAVTVGTELRHLRHPVLEHRHRRFLRRILQERPEAPRHAWTNELINGGRDVQRPCPISEMPVYMRAGNIQPWGPEVQYSSEKPWDNLDMRIYPGADGSFTLYEDRGDGYDYERGRYTRIEFRWDEAQRTLTIGRREGSFPEMLRSRKFNIVLVNPSAGRGAAALQTVRTVDYDGEEVVLKL